MNTDTQLTADEARAQIEKILANCEVTFSVIYAGETKQAFGETQSHPMGKWSVAFTVRDGRAAHEEFEFFTGLGHRKPNESPMAKASAHSLRSVSKRMLAWEKHYKNYPDKPQAPHPADVLHSIILDSSAVGQSFESWCSDFGYDTDSRKAYATYEACQKNADKLARVFDTTARTAIAEALQDY